MESTHIGHWKVKVEKWVALLPLLEVCIQETRHEGGGMKRWMWWRQGTTADEMRTTLKESFGDRQQRYRDGVGTAEIQE